MLIWLAAPPAWALWLALAWAALTFAGFALLLFVAAWTRRRAAELDPAALLGRAGDDGREEDDDGDCLLRGLDDDERHELERKHG